MNRSEIKSTEWGISVAGAGEVVQGMDDINQCIDVIFRTNLGSDPLRPLFGSKVYAYQDKPLNEAVPNVKKEMLRALTMWEKRITVTKVTHTLTDVSTVVFTVDYKINNSVQTGQAEYVYGIK